MTIPLCFHGDEGRGLAKVAINIDSFQPVISWMGEHALNMLGSLDLLCISLPLVILAYWDL